MPNDNLYINENDLRDLRSKFTAGQRVRLVRMDDPYRDMPSGLLGTVMCVDDTGTIHVNWDNGSSLGVVYNVDIVELV